MKIIISASYLLVTVNKMPIDTKLDEGNLGEGDPRVAGPSATGLHTNAILDTFTDLTGFLANKKLVLDDDYKITQGGMVQVLWLRNNEGKLVQAGIFDPFALKPDYFEDFYQKCTQVVDSDFIMMGVMKKLPFDRTSE